MVIIVLMKQLSFQLVPFTKASSRTAASRFQISGQLRRSSKIIEVEYTVTDPYFDIIWPKALSHPLREDNLWQHTCFELFLAPWGMNEYWEYNFSPNRNWNCYRFSAYRENQRTERSLFSCKIIHIENDNLTHKITASIPIIETFRKYTLSTGISAVIEDKSGTLHYYALTHTNNSKPDFHDSRSFMLTLGPH